MSTLEDELNRAVARSRGGQRSGELVDELLSAEHHRSLLVGITPDGRLFTYAYGIGDLFEYELEPDVVNLRRHTIQSVTDIQHVPQLEAWIQDNSEQFQWLHPRWRWVE